MSDLVVPPAIDGRTAGELTRALRRMAPHYVREWSAKDEHDPGVGLIKLFAFIAEGVIARLNAAPQKNFVDFLDMLGIRLLPATPARAAVRFMPATGTTTTILVPPRTRVSAAVGDAVLPFETESHLLVIPAALTALVSVDPAVDAIFDAPAAFLQLRTAASDEEPRTIVAFSSAGSNSFQLDLVDALNPNDILRITSGAGSSGRSGCDLPTSSSSAATATEYVVVAKVDGQIVFVTEPLARDYTAGAAVQKVTRFTLLGRQDGGEVDGKNFQEHVLYLGHDELFNVKSAATFEILATPRAGAPAGGPPLRVLWEFWGVPEGSKEPAWHALTPDADGTAGLTQGGRIVLTKVPGEIKARPVNGVEKRWIRARLAEPILPGRRDQLPELESVTFRTSSAESGIAADAGFFNETPLDVNLEFRPFGFEPRTFDRFYLGSAEAFSKPGAEVSIDTRLDVSDLLMGPAAVRFGTHTFAFAHGAGGRLLRFESKPAEPTPSVPRDLRQPPGTRMTAGTTPAVAVNGAALGVFLRADDGFVWLARFGQEQQEDPSWIPLQAPAGVRSLKFDPAVISVGSAWQVYIVADNDVYTRSVDAANPQQSAPEWTATNLPAVAGSTPFVAQRDGPDPTWVFVTDVGGVCYRLRTAGQPWDVITPRDQTGAPLDGTLGAAGARPFASLRTVRNSTRAATVFLRSHKNRVVELEVPENPGDPVTHIDWGPDTPAVASDPWVLGRPNEWQVFMRGSDDGLWEAGAPQNWRVHTNLTGASLQRNPVAIVHSARVGSATQSFLSVFSASGRNTLIEFRTLFEEPDTGNVLDGPESFIFVRLDTRLRPTAATHFVFLSKRSGRQLRRISEFVGSANLVVVTERWGAIPEADDEFEVLAAESTGDVVSADAEHITLEPDSGADDGVYVLVHLASGTDAIRKITSFDSDTDVAILDEPWDTIPATGDAYELLESEQTGSVLRDSNGAVRVAGLHEEDEVEGAFIDFPGHPENPPGRVDEYNADASLVIAAVSFVTFPRSGMTYRILVSPDAETWEEHREVAQTDLRPKLSWEYWNGASWASLRVEDGTQNLLVPGQVKFRTPDDIAKIDVAGQANYWVRARIIGGDYGREIFEIDRVTNQITIRKEPIRPPLITALSIEYELTEDRQPERCLTFNNLAYVDQTAANNTPDKHFPPFAALPDTAPTVYFGFDKPFHGGPIRMYVAAREMAVDDDAAPRLAWEFRGETDWRTVPADDQTNAFTRPSLVTLQLSDVLPRRSEFGRALHWLRARRREGRWPEPPVLAGVFPNTVFATQAETVRNEILGTSTAAQNQRFRFQRKPVLPGEELRVREALTGDERDEVVAADGEEALLEIRDQQGAVLSTWVRWRPVDELFDASPASRVYRIDRASGEVEFGDGVHGRVPPAGGDNVVAFAYQSGGGKAGNVAAGAVTSLVTAVAGVDSVVNPVAAGGGSEEATIEEMLRIGPAQISHRGRAVTPDDFESLAREASREVRKTRCVPNRNARGQHERGAVSVYIVPAGTDARPEPSLELRRAVQRQLEGSCDVALAARRGISVGPPDYVAVAVDVTVFVRTIDETAVAEQKAADALSTFLHPLTGGLEGEGWAFGQDLAVSHLYTLLERIPEIDHVEQIVLRTERGEFRSRLEIGEHELLASGDHTVRMAVANGG